MSSENIKSLSNKIEKPEEGAQVKTIEEVEEIINGAITYEAVPDSEKDSRKIPAVFFPGWSSSVKVLKRVVKQLASCGRKVATAEHRHYGSQEVDEKLKKIKEVEGTTQQEIDKVLTMLALIDKKRYEKIDAVGHSEGGMNLVLAAWLCPEKFRNIVLVGPSGLLETNNWLLTTVRFNRHILDELKEWARSKDRSEKERIRDILEDVVSYAFKNPKRRAGEVQAIGGLRIADLMKDLIDKGVGISVVAMKDDAVVPPDKLKKTLQHNPDIISPGRFYEISGNHGEVLSNPDFFKLINVILEHMSFVKEDKNNINLDSK